MSSPGGSYYMEYRRSRTPSRDRNVRGSQSSQEGNRGDSSNGIKQEGNYRVNSLALEETDPLNDEYRPVFKKTIICTL